MGWRGGRFRAKDVIIDMERDPAEQMSGPSAWAAPLHRHDDLVYVTGQTGVDPVTGAIVAGGFEAQLTQAFDNLAAILEGEGSSLTKVVKAQIELVDECDFPAMNRLYAERFSPPLPARSSFGVPFLPDGAVVQIDVIAALEQP